MRGGGLQLANKGNVRLVSARFGKVLSLVEDERWTRQKRSQDEGRACSRVPRSDRLGYLSVVRVAGDQEPRPQKEERRAMDLEVALVGRAATACRRGIGPRAEFSGGYVLAPSGGIFVEIPSQPRRNGLRACDRWRSLLCTRRTGHRLVPSGFCLVFDAHPLCSCEFHRSWEVSQYHSEAGDSFKVVRAEPERVRDTRIRVPAASPATGDIKPVPFE